MHWIITGVKPVTVLKHVVSRDFILKKCLSMWTVQYPIKNKEIYGIALHQNLFCIIFKKETSARGSQVGQMWITPRLLCVSVDQVHKQVWPTFNPEIDSHSDLKQLFTSIFDNMEDNSNYIKAGLPFLTVRCPTATGLVLAYCTRFLTSKRCTPKLLQVVS